MSLYDAILRLRKAGCIVERSTRRGRHVVTRLNARRPLYCSSAELIALAAALPRPAP